LPGWSAKTAYNRGQVMYRLAEMVEDRRHTFVGQVALGGGDGEQASIEVDASIDRLIWYAGWSDKFDQVAGNLNPVAGPFFNISSPEPTGVVGMVAAERPPLLGLVSRLAPIIISGNTAVVLPSQDWPLPALTLAEALATADLPSGVVNVVSGHKDETVPVLAAHMDVNAFDAFGLEWEQVADVERLGAGNLKRVARPPTEPIDWFDDRRAQSPYWISAFTEIKTVWHPQGV
ncbi:MAG: aldehyde dehydrogenase family protein, partial [Actinomycetota bacterium]|nr:aldehyde dehydrogenase family protein [Actinomycetota bacterium]